MYGTIVSKRILTENKGRGSISLSSNHDEYRIYHSRIIHLHKWLILLTEEQSNQLTSMCELYGQWIRYSGSCKVPELNDLVICGAKYWPRRLEFESHSDYFYAIGLKRRVFSSEWVTQIHYNVDAVEPSNTWNSLALTMSIQYRVNHSNSTIVWLDSFIFLLVDILR